jgi:hypothetical protein
LDFSEPSFFFGDSFQSSLVLSLIRVHLCLVRPKKKGRRTIGKDGALSAASTVFEMEHAATVAQDCLGLKTREGAMQDARWLGQCARSANPVLMTNQEIEQSALMS